MTQTNSISTPLHFYTGDKFLVHPNFVEFKKICTVSQLSLAFYHYENTVFPRNQFALVNKISVDNNIRQSASVYIRLMV